MEHQKKSFGEYSDEIDDYTKRGLVPIPDTDLARGLWKMVDPYFYRERIGQPKLLILGNNDPYWTVDALNLYWDGLKGDKYITYVPNAGHDLRQGGEHGNQGRALASLEAFALLNITGKPLPKITWQNDEIDGKFRITATADVTPKAARVWLAKSPTKDFRKAEWKELPAAIDGNTVRGTVTGSVDSYEAFYVDMDYDASGLGYHLCTQIRVLPPVKKKELRRD
jgi:PhoPQ-activated pathogenicity-related protein